jgi:heptosyltransferase-2
VYRRILVVDLLGGLGDLVMVLPVVQALTRRHPGAALRVLTHAPGDVLLRSDPAVAGTTTAERGRERDAVAAELDRWRPDLVVSTTRYGGIPAEIESRGVRCVTDLWRRPPPDEPVSRRYLRILAAEGLVADEDLAPALHLTPAEHTAGDRTVAALARDAVPVVLVPAAGMAVKVWPYWSALATALVARGLCPLVAGEPPVLAAWRNGPARALPAADLRGLAAVCAAAGRRGGVAG